MRRSNAQAQQLTGLPEREIDISDRERLWRLVERRFHLVGTSDDSRRFVFHLHLFDGFPLLLFNDRLVRPDAQAFHPSERELARVRELTRLDAALYDLVKEKFEERVATTWSGTALADYPAYRAALEDPPDANELDFELDCARLHIAIQWLGWSPEWTPPPEHARDWRAELPRLAERVGL